MKGVIVIDSTLFSKKSTELFCIECNQPLGLYDLAYVRILNNRRYRAKYYCLDCAVQYFIIFIRNGKYYLPISKSVRRLLQRLNLYVTRRKLQCLLGYSPNHNMIKPIIDGKINKLDVVRLKTLSKFAKEFFRESNPEIEIVMNNKVYCDCCHNRFENKDFVFILNKPYSRSIQKLYCINCAPRVFNLYDTRKRKHYVPINDTIKYVINRLLEVYSIKELIRMLGFSSKRRSYISHIMNGRIRFIALDKLKILNSLFKNLSNVKDVRIEVWSNKKIRI